MNPEHRSEGTAIDKGKEIGRYLCDELGLSRDVVKLRREPTRQRRKT